MKNIVGQQIENENKNKRKRQTNKGTNEQFVTNVYKVSFVFSFIFIFSFFQFIIESKGLTVEYKHKFFMFE